MIKFINKPEQLNEKKAKRFLQKSALIFNVSIGKIVYEFVTKDKMLNLNKRFLNHNTDTDIITFVYGTKKNILSEIFISIKLANENAKTYNQSIENEIVRLISHGFLHSIGFKDKSKLDKMEMSRQEEKMINLFHVKH
tara:strand:- start:925 stop:1338 length:414 start_codon:yes stop_codon:yes gene_type:complete